MGILDDLADIFLGKTLEDWQKATPRPFDTGYWKGTTAANRIRPRGLRKAVLSMRFRPNVSSFHINSLFDRISSIGNDMIDEFWFQQASIAPDWAGLIDAMAVWIRTGNMQDASLVVTDTDVDVTSAAAFVHTCPANRMQEVALATVRNSTRAFSVAMAYTPNGGTAQILNETIVGVIGRTSVIIGGGSSVTGGVQGAHFNGPLRMQPGDTLEISNPNFVAADVMRKEIIFDEWVV